MGKPKILVVDDDHGICSFLVEYFVEEGYDVRSAMNGLDAVDITREFEPDAMLLDMNMPHMGGMDVIKNVREFNGKVAIIVVTGMMDEELGKSALSAGANDYIVKPINLDYLKQSVLVNYLERIQ